MTVEHYEFGKITIDGRTYTSDVIVWPEGVDDSWWRVAGHGLCQKDLEPLLDKNPDVLIIGIGAYRAMRVPPEMVRYMTGKCDEVHVEQTDRACEIYNEQAGAGRRVVAGLHLTC
ncbi:MAG: Mth938-like domain-containing protein [Candidatus Brocadiae bacterium]|nr:Mth938-like domain-containing protein [Candidatus Brocadiia bacterium]